jgi:integrase/recombinase XerD
MHLLPDHGRQEEARAASSGDDRESSRLREEGASRDGAVEVVPAIVSDATSREETGEVVPAIEVVASSNCGRAETLPPAFGGGVGLTGMALRAEIAKAASDWLSRTPSVHTRAAYVNDLKQFIAHVGLADGEWEGLTRIRPGDVAAWRDALQAAGQTNATVRRKLTAVRSLFSYLNIYGHIDANPAHGKFVQAPSVGKDGKTPGLTPKECRRLLDAPEREIPSGVRDRALLAVLAYTGCRVGELTRLRVRSYKQSSGHKVLAIVGKGGKERTVPLNPEAFERLDTWIALAGIADEPAAPLFPPTKTPRGQGRDGFAKRPLSRRSIELLVHRYASTLGFDPGITVHSLRVTALTTARERGSDIIDLQDFAGHTDPRTTLTYIRTRDRLSKSPAYVLTY